MENIKFNLEGVTTPEAVGITPEEAPAYNERMDKMANGLVERLKKGEIITSGKIMEEILKLEDREICVLAANYLGDYLGEVLAKLSNPLASIMQVLEDKFESMKERKTEDLSEIKQVPGEN